jgi:hypothetical protein
MIIEEISTDSFDASYDDETRLLRVHYKGMLTPDVTVQFYRWLGEVITRRAQELMQVRGSIYDFRDLKGFASTNLTSAQRQSQQLNSKADMSHIPVALIAKDRMQAELLRVELKISPQQERKALVWSEEEALEFIARFNPVNQP